MNDSIMNCLNITKLVIVDYFGQNPFIYYVYLKLYVYIEEKFDC